MFSRAVLGVLIVFALAFALLSAACGPLDAQPTVTPQPYNPTQGALLLLTPTTIPVAPIEEGPEIRDAGLGAVGVSNSTQAALPAEGQPAVDLPTSTPRATLANFPMQIGASDGLLLQGAYYSAAQRPAPGVLMLYQDSGDRTAWDALAAQLQSAGYTVLSVDLRGYGATGGAADWNLASLDVAAALAQLAELPGVDAQQLSVIGAGTSANLALNACADRAGCQAAVLLSPGLDYLGITTPNAMARLGARAVLIVASENDGNNPTDSVTLDGLAQGTHRLVIYPDAGHGFEMLSSAPDLTPLIAQWLALIVPPPALES